MNWDTFKKLTPHDQAVVETVSFAGPHWAAVSNATFGLYGVENKWTKDHEWISLSSEDMAAMKVRFKPLWDKWAKGLDDKGVQGTKILNEAIRLVNKYQKY